jgi:hypothetical protein
VLPVFRVPDCPGMVSIYPPAKRLQAGFSNFRQNKKVEKIFKNREKTP